MKRNFFVILNKKFKFISLYLTDIFNWWYYNRARNKNVSIPGERHFTLGGRGHAKRKRGYPIEKLGLRIQEANTIAVNGASRDCVHDHF